MSGIILDGALADAKLYISVQWRDRISKIPSYSQKILREMTNNKQYNSELYKIFESKLTDMFTCRLIPKPECFMACFEKMNIEIYQQMQGESEFTIGGVLENWSVLDRLKNVNVPAVVILGEFDTMSEECGQVIVDNIPTCWPLVIIPRAGHCKLCDEPQLVVQSIEKFLNTSEATRKTVV